MSKKQKSEIKGKVGKQNRPKLKTLILFCVIVAIVVFCIVVGIKLNNKNNPSTQTVNILYQI